MTKTLSVLALALLAVVALTVADKAQENPRITAEATTATPTPAPTLQPKPAPVRKYTDQQLQDWAATDAVDAWNESDIQLGPDHHFNWFEIGVGRLNHRRAAYLNALLPVGPSLRSAFGAKPT